MTASVLFLPNKFKTTCQTLHAMIKGSLSKIFRIQVRISVFSDLCVSDDSSMVNSNEFLLLFLLLRLVLAHLINKPPHSSPYLTD